MHVWFDEYEEAKDWLEFMSVPIPDGAAANWITKAHKLAYANPDRYRAWVARRRILGLSYTPTTKD